MQTDLEGLFAQMDKALHGAETGVVTKEEMRAALEEQFQVGKPGGKTLDRFDEIMQVPVPAPLQATSAAMFICSGMDRAPLWQHALRSTHVCSIPADLQNHACMQALDEDQEGPTVVLKKLFEEDREFNQGGVCPTHSIMRATPCSQH